AAPVVFPRDLGVLLLRVERGVHVRELGELERPALLQLRSTRTGGARPPRPGLAAVVATARGRDESENTRERQYLQISPHVTPLSTFPPFLPSVSRQASGTYHLCLRRAVPSSFQEAASRLDTVSHPSWDRGRRGARPRPG